jgi:hypothetical protein
MLRGPGAAFATGAILLLCMTPTVAARPLPQGLVTCGAEGTVPDATVLGLGLGGTPLPAAEDGVVTGWTVFYGGAKGPLEQRLQVFRRVDGPVNRFLAVAESSPRVTPSRSRAFFKTRIPVESGDLFALRGTVETLLCRGVFGVTSGLHAGPTEVGSPYEFRAEEGLGVPLGVDIEPDGDGDGYGDRTQDHCIRVATTQDGCPAVKLRVEGATAGERSIRLDLRVETKAKVRVEGQIGFPFDPPGTDNDGTATAVVGSGVKTLLPGRASRIRIKLPEEVQRHLAELRPQRSLKARMIVYAVSVAGREVERRLTIRLRGRRDV